MVKSVQISSDQNWQVGQNSSGHPYLDWSAVGTSASLCFQVGAQLQYCGVAVSSEDSAADCAALQRHGPGIAWEGTPPL